MVALSHVTESNQRVAATFPSGLVAVFVGGTSGVGEYTIQALAKHASNPRVYIVGRSQEAADRIVAECKQLNKGGIFEFIKADVSLLKNVDDVCRQIRSKETYINILFESQGSMGFTQKTSEGLPIASGLIMHSRLRFILNLLPLIQKASGLRRVVSVQAATFEGPIDLDNIIGQGFALRKWRNQVASVQSLMLGEAARRAPSVGFIHTLPGVVKSGISRDAEGLGMAVLIKVTSFLQPLIETPPLESGERHVFYATSAMYPAREDKATGSGIELENPLSIARGADGRDGSGMYSVDVKGESASPKVEQLLAQFKNDGTAEKVWNYITGDFKRITGTEVAE
ncbi:putative short-chain dehydrogenases/reductase [Hypoxylon sp. FL1284]|nr:putative short-chain dehydrogenases/reductase [Hypoxylon sp. FL1284]